MRTKSGLRSVMVWAALLLAAACLCVPALRGAAAQTGTIEMAFPADADAAGIGMTLYSVASYEEGQGFRYQGVFEGCEVSLAGLEGAEQAQQAAEQLAALAKDRNAVGTAGTVGADGVLRYTSLAPAYYLLVQTDGTDRIEIQKMLIPIPYTEENGVLSYTAELTPKYAIPEGAVILHKVDDDSEAVGQARFKLQRKVYISGEGSLPEGAETGQDGDGRFFWEEYQDNLVTDEYGQIALSKLPMGVYRFVETEAPEGYILKDAPGYFSIEKSGGIRTVEGVYQKASGSVEELTVVNQQTSLLVNKVDADGNAVSGAKLVLKDADGNVLLDDEGMASYLFTTDGKPTVLKRLAPGEYYLSEVVSPEGYQVAADVKLTVSAEEDAANEVTMVDEKIKETKAGLQVKKRLEDAAGLALSAEDQDFYVALFEDDGLTNRISDVKTLHFAGGSSSEVSFANLDPRGTYYVSETDEYGSPLISAAVDEAVFAPEYPDGSMVEMTTASQLQSLDFKNVFYADLPYGFYYSGDLTVTKRVLKGGELCDSEEVFYAAVFTDADCTERYGDVLELSMDGSSEMSVTITVPIGESPDDSATYYVTETDENGVALENGAGLEFVFDVAQGEVTISPQDPTAEVVITNVFPGEETESESEPETESEPQSETEPETREQRLTEPDQPSTPGGSNSSSGGSDHSDGREGGSTPVRTGDETPVAQYLVLLAVSALIILVIVILFARKRKK